MPKEGFCCTCGKTTLGFYKPKNDGKNPTTMCDECTEEESNYCCKCRTDLKANNDNDNDTLICQICMKKLREKENLIYKLEKILSPTLIDEIKKYLQVR